MNIKVTYTVASKTQSHSDFSKENKPLHSASLVLDNQPGAPVNHWGSMPYRLKICGPDAEEISLGDKYVLTIERQE